MYYLRKYNIETFAAYLLNNLYVWNKIRTPGIRKGTGKVNR